MYGFGLDCLVKGTGYIGHHTECAEDIYPLTLLAACLHRLMNTFQFVGPIQNRVPTVQGGYQAAAMCVALVFGIGGGILVGEYR